MKDEVNVFDNIYTEYKNARLYINEQTAKIAEEVLLKEASGRTSADFVNLYAPGGR